MSTEFYAYFANIFQKNCGLRLMECMQLRIKDIDFESNGRVFFFGALFADNGTRVYEGAAKRALWVQRSETANPKLSEVIFIYIGYLKDPVQIFVHFLHLSGLLYFPPLQNLGRLPCFHQIFYVLLILCNS